MFVEKLSKRELCEFVRKIGFEPKENALEIKLNKDEEPVVFVACQPQKFEKDIYQKVLNWSGLGYFGGNNTYDLGATLVLTDFDCCDILHTEKEYHDDWQQFMYKKFGDKYVKALDRAVEKQRTRQNQEQER